MSDQEVLSLTNIHKAFGGVVAIEDFSLNLKAGEVVALVGDNGAGKSTLIKIISGVYTPTSGEILLDGEAADIRDASAARANGIEVVYQDLALADQQPVYMNMFLGRELTKGPLNLLDKARMRQETQDLVDELDVRIPSASSTISDLSGGQRPGIAIARAMVLRPKLLVLDEPTSALDMTVQVQIVDLLRDLQQKHGLAYLFISHDLHVVQAMRHKMIVMQHGDVVEAGPAAALFTNPPPDYAKPTLAATV